MTALSTTPLALESYVCGQWVRGAKAGTPLLNAATGEVVALIDASGIDPAAVLAHGRAKGGTALRRMSFHERAGMLKALGQYLMAGKEEFYTLSTATGATSDGGSPEPGAAKVRRRRSASRLSLRRLNTS